MFRCWRLTHHRSCYKNDQPGAGLVVFYVNLSCVLRRRVFFLFHPGHAEQDEQDPGGTQQAERAVEHIVQRQRHPEIADQHQNGGDQRVGMQRPDDLQQLREQSTDAPEIDPPGDGCDVAPRELLPVFEHKNEQQRQNCRLHIVDQRTVGRAEQLSGPDIRHAVDGVEKPVQQGSQIIDHAAASSVQNYKDHAQQHECIARQLPPADPRDRHAEQTEPVDQRRGDELPRRGERHKRARADMQRTPAGGRDDPDAHRADQIHIPRRAGKPQRLPLDQQIAEQQHERDAVDKEADAEQTEVVAHLRVERDHDALQNAGQKQKSKIQQSLSSVSQRAAAPDSSVKKRSSCASGSL